MISTKSGERVVHQQHVPPRTLHSILQDRARTQDMGARLSLPQARDDPFVRIMFAIPRLLARRASCDESFQLRSVAYLAAATAYCCNRTKAGVPGWFATSAGENERLWGTRGSWIRCIVSYFVGVFQSTSAPAMPSFS